MTAKDAMKGTRPQSLTDFVFLRRTLIVVAIGCLLSALWMLAQVILLVFAAVLVAVMLRALAAPVANRTGISDRWAVALAGLLVVTLLAAAVLGFGADLSEQLKGLSGRLSAAANTLGEKLQIVSVADLLKGENPASSLGSIAGSVLAWSTTALGVLASVMLVIFGGIYLALDPDLYRRGLLKLIPPAVQPNVAAAFDDAGEALRRWLGAQIIAMALVGVLTALGFWLIGLPSSLALGVIAGLAEFVPMVGPIVASIPAILLASADGWQTVASAIAVVAVIQQLESHLITPMIVGSRVSVAPAVALFGIVSMGVIFGPLGLLLGFPLAIVLDLAVRRLYVRDTLGQGVEINGRPSRQEG